MEKTGADNDRSLERCARQCHLHRELHPQLCGSLRAAVFGNSKTGLQCGKLVICNEKNAYTGRASIIQRDNHTLGVINLNAGKDYIIDVAALIEQAGTPVDEWYLEGKYLYAQDICDWDIGVLLPDGFYRIDFELLKSKQRD